MISLLKTSCIRGECGNGKGDGEWKEEDEGEERRGSRREEKRRRGREGAEEGETRRGNNTAQTVTARCFLFCFVYHALPVWGSRLSVWKAPGHGADSLSRSLSRGCALGSLVTESLWSCLRTYAQSQSHPLLGLETFRQVQISWPELQDTPSIDIHIDGSPPPCDSMRSPQSMHRATAS